MTKREYYREMELNSRDDPGPHEMARHESLTTQILAPSGLMAIEHARQAVWEQAMVGVLCAVGGCLLAYWSLQGVVGLMVILLCVAFSTLVTAALCRYYDQSVRMDARERGRVPGRPMIEGRTG